MITSSLSAFEELILRYQGHFTAPSLDNFQSIIEGWLLTPGRKTIANMIRVAGAEVKKHHSAFYNFFSRAAWEMKDLKTDLQSGVVKFFYPDSAVPVMTCGDDTVYRKTGRKTYGTGVFRDPVLSSRNQVVYCKGHNWVTFGLIVAPEFMQGKNLCLPLDEALYLKQQDVGRSGEFRSHSELMVEMLSKFAERFPDRLIYHSVDGAYANEVVIGQRPKNVHIISRLRQDAALYEIPVRPLVKRQGRPCRRGKKLPRLTDLALEERIPWRETEVFIYGEKRPVLVKEIKALWYHVEKERPIKAVIVRDTHDEKKTDYFFNTDGGASAELTIEGFAGRWSIEVMYRESNQQMGVADAQNRMEKSVERSTPFGFFLMSNIIFWYAQYGHKADVDYQKVSAWYWQKETPSFADMLAALRRLYWRKRIYGNSSGGWSLRKSINLMINALAKAS